MNEETFKFIFYSFNKEKVLRILWENFLEFSLEGSGFLISVYNKEFWIVWRNYAESRNRDSLEKIYYLVGSCGKFENFERIGKNHQNSDKVVPNP